MSLIPPLIEKMRDNAQWDALTAQTKRAVIKALNDDLVELRVRLSSRDWMPTAVRGKDWRIVKMDGKLLPSAEVKGILAGRVLFSHSDMCVEKKYRIPKPQKARKGK